MHKSTPARHFHHRSPALAQILTIVASFFLFSGIVVGKKAVETASVTRSLANTSCISANTNGATQVQSPGGTLCSENFAYGIDITGNDTTLTCNGVTIDGNNNTDTTKSGISVFGRSNVTISGCRVKGFFAGLTSENSSNVTVENSDFSLNSKGGQDHEWLADLMTKPDTGGGIIFKHVQNSKIANSNASQNIAGVSVFDSKNIEINGGNYSSNTGWGVRLIRTTDSKVTNVKADDNNRINSQCSQGGCESAGILLMENSNNNQIENNSLNNGGNGFYINGNGGSPSNNNIIINNTANADSTHRSGNGFEATFSEGNVFEKNTSNGHNYGFWLGYSHKSVVNNNTVDAIQGGISIPASQCNAVINNTTKNGQTGQNHIFTESNDMGGKSRFCKDNYLTNNSPALDTDNCENTSTQPITTCNLNISPIPTSPQNTIPPPATSTTPNPSNPPGNNGTTTLRIEVWITKSGQARRLWNAGDGTGVVYIKGPTASGADRFSVEMRVPTSSGVFQDTEGHFFRGEPGVVLWAGAGTSEGDPGAGTSPGRYTTNMSSLPSGLGPVPYPNVFATVSQGQTGVAILDVVEGQVNTTPTPDGNTPTATPTPTPGGNGNLSTGYTNADYQRIINQYAQGEVSALDVSRWISEATRSPGLQLSTCDPTIPEDCSGL